MPAFLDNLKLRARQLNEELYALYLAYKDPRVPVYARIFAACVVGYAFSPIDLIPDPIPILGYLDDLLLVPLGIWLALKMIPGQVMAESRLKAKEGLSQRKPVNWLAGAIILVIWLVVAALVVRFAMRLFGK
jgi:uncharacterized membrane protein YkvA (DUF1232 family)